MTVPKGECLTRSLANALVALEQRIKRLLIVDDDVLTTDFVSAMVRREFYGVAISASSCREARQLLNDCEPFDAAILDHALTNGVGLELYAEIKKRWPQMKVVFLTGYDSPGLRRKVEGIGAARVHSKDAMSDLNFTRELLEEVGLKRRIEHADWAAGGI
jgi:DNA-binding NarL/FixJ family response regulator